MESPVQTHFNINIIWFRYYAEHEDLGCKYGGISLFDFILDQMEETRSYCTTRLYDQFNLQPFYSKNNKTIIVMYSYKHYSRLSVAINVSITDCHIVKTNVCEMNLVSKVSKKLCYSFWKNETVSIKPHPSR